MTETESKITSQGRVPHWVTGFAYFSIAVVFLFSVYALFSLVFQVKAKTAEIKTNKELAVSIAAAEGLQLMQKFNCNACHLEQGDAAGPSYSAIASRYSLSDIQYLSLRILSGGESVWGRAPKLPSAGIQKIEAEKMALGILATLARIGLREAASGHMAENAGNSPGPGSSALLGIFSHMARMFLFLAAGLAFCSVSMLILSTGRKDDPLLFFARESSRLLHLVFPFTLASGAAAVLVSSFYYPVFSRYMVSALGWSLVPLFFFIFAAILLFYAFSHGWGRFSRSRQAAVGVFLAVSNACIVFIIAGWSSFQNTPGGFSSSGVLVDHFKTLSNDGWASLGSHFLLMSLVLGGAVLGSFGTWRIFSGAQGHQRRLFDQMVYTGGAISVVSFMAAQFTSRWHLWVLSGSLASSYSSSALKSVRSSSDFMDALTAAAFLLAANFYLWVKISQKDLSASQKKLCTFIVVCAGLSLGFIMLSAPFEVTMQEAFQLGEKHNPLLELLEAFSIRNVAVVMLMLSTFLSFLVFTQHKSPEYRPFDEISSKVHSAVITFAFLCTAALGLYQFSQPLSTQIMVSAAQVSIVFLSAAVISVSTVLFSSPASAESFPALGSTGNKALLMPFLMAVTAAWSVGMQAHGSEVLRMGWHVSGAVKNNLLGGHIPGIGAASCSASAATLLFLLFLLTVFHFSVAPEVRPPAAQKEAGL